MSKAEVLPDRYAGGVQHADQHLVDEVLRALMREALVERDQYELLHSELLDQLGLRLQAGEQLRRRLGADDLQRVRLEGQHRVAAADHLAMAAVNAIELAHRDPARPRLGLVELAHLHRRGSLETKP